MGLWDSIKDKAADAFEEHQLPVPDECRDEWLAAFRTLRDLDTDGGFKTEKELQKRILDELEDDYAHLNPQEETPQGRGRIDITIGKSVGIELKIKSGKTAIDRAIAQVNGYADDWYMFLFVYADSARTMRRVKEAVETRLDEHVVAIIACDDQYEVVTWKDGFHDEDDDY